ncbi:nucleotidyltransferase domain-containing protein [bacterium 0.1xD8-71]|nr:nucleotidyltransferase domain-containing protein [bacterium 0.1xD8-71]
MYTENQVNNIVGQISQFYRSVYGDKIVSIYLYGSYARGNYTEESDIDIIAIVRGDRMDLQEKLKQIWDVSADIGLENDVVVSPTVIPYAEYEAYKEILPYYMNIQKEGKRIG